MRGGGCRAARGMTATTGWAPTLPAAAPPSSLSRESPPTFVRSSQAWVGKSCMYAPRHPRLWLCLSFESARADPVLQGGDWLGNCSTAANPCRVAQEDCKLPRYRCHLGCILLKMAAISLPTGPNGPGNAGNILPGSGRSSWDPITVSRTIIAGDLGCILPRVPAIIVRTGAAGGPWLGGDASSGDRPGG